MKILPLSWKIALSAIFVFSLFFLPLSSLSSDGKGDLSDQCLDCHDGYDQTLKGSVHQLQGPNHANPVMCANCHRGAEVHINDPDISNITNPSRVPVETAAEICRTCHYTDHQQYLGERNIHTENDIGCLSCHKIHDNHHLSLLKDTELELCYGCHPGVRGEFSYPYRHPVQDGIMTCSECHTDLGRISGGLADEEASRMCFRCHNEFQGPFPYEHQATVEYSTEEGGCLNCHAAHGSDLPRMLAQPLDPPNYALCSQCHITPAGHAYNSYHQDRWANRPCGTCHVDIHGSYFNKQFLKPTLPDEEGINCFASGCHDS